MAGCAARCGGARRRPGAPFRASVPPLRDRRICTAASSGAVGRPLGRGLLRAALRGRLRGGGLAGVAPLCIRARVLSRLRRGATRTRPAACCRAAHARSRALNWRAAVASIIPLPSHPAPTLLAAVVAVLTVTATLGTDDARRNHAADGLASSAVHRQRRATRESPSALEPQNSPLQTARQHTHRTPQSHPLARRPRRDHCRRKRGRVSATARVHEQVANRRPHAAHTTGDPAQP